MKRCYSDPFGNVNISASPTQPSERVGAFQEWFGAVSRAVDMRYTRFG